MINKDSFKKLTVIPPVGWMLILIIITFSAFSEDYLSMGNLVNVLIQASPLMILALGQTLVILAEGIDLSLGSQVSFCTVLFVWLIRAGVPVVLAIVIVLLVLTLIGSINGFFVGFCNIPPFIVTIAMLNILHSVAIMITSGASIYHYHPIFERISSGAFLFIPNPILLVIAIFALSWTLLHKTTFGVRIRGLGGNKEALSFAGVSPSLAMLKVYAYAGFLAGVCGILTTARVESGQPIVATGWEFDAVAATLLGGTSLYGGKGDILGTIFGVLLIKILQNGLNVVGVSTLYHSAIIGLVVLIAIVIDALIERENNCYQEVR